MVLMYYELRNDANSKYFYVKCSFIRADSLKPNLPIMMFY